MGGFATTEGSSECATASTVKETRARAYCAIDPIDWPEGSMSLKS